MPKQTADKTIENAKQRLVTRALAALRERHQEEYNEIAEELFRKEGLEFRPRLTPEERAQRQIMAIAKKAGLAVTIDGTHLEEFEV